MIIYDISKEVFSSNVYPGDPVPKYTRIKEIQKGDVCNLSMITTCAHNATHLDAPFHFCARGKTVEAVELKKCIGTCMVISRIGKLVAEDIKQELEKTAVRKILIKGDVEITEEVAKVMAEYEVELLGVEGFTVGTEETGCIIHKTLLEKEIVIVESLDLSEIAEGEYFLVAPPVKYGSLDGAPCRAVLIDFGGGTR